MEPPELVILFADADAERFVTKLVERAVERGCLRPLAWRAIRDPMHDARVANEPTAALAPFLRGESTRFIVICDHAGSGREDVESVEVEQDVVAALERSGVGRDRVFAIAFAPELEVVFEPVWERVLTELSKRRAVPPSSEPFVRSAPKESFQRALAAHRLRSSAPLFAELGGVLSLTQLKSGGAIGRLAERLTAWFGTPSG